MKVITVTNWIFIGFHALLVIYTLLVLNRSGTDAAGQGMEAGFALIGFFLLVGLIVLNILPYRFSKITALIVLTLPALITGFNVTSTYFESRKQDKTEAAQANGSFYFDDALRRNLAAAIAVADTVRLRLLLQKPVPNLNECGDQATTLLDFAAYRCIDGPAPEQQLRCLEILLEKGATIRGPAVGHLPTHFLICQTGPVALLEWFLKKGVDPNLRPFKESNPILFEVMGYDRDRLVKVKCLLDYGADPNAQAAAAGYAVRSRYSPLMHAALEQLWDVCDVLVKRGSNPDYRTPQGDDLKKIMALHEKLYADAGDTPTAFTDFKKMLESHENPKNQ